MGQCCAEKVPHAMVTYMPNEIPNEPMFTDYQPQSNRFGDISVQREENCNYTFVMSVGKDQGEELLKVKVPVLTQISHCATIENYKLKIGQMIIDIFKKTLSNTFVKVKNQQSSKEYLMKICPFTTYHSFAFKQALYEIWLNLKIEHKLENHHLYILELQDFYIYGVNEEKQAVVMLFESAGTSLANFAEYRYIAGWNWSASDKVVLTHQILAAYSKLQEIKDLSVYHRDLRPNNIFYVPRTNRFVIGNFSRAKHAYYVNDNVENQWQLHTVTGIPFFTEGQLKDHIEKEQAVGFYDLQKADYSGLKAILNIIETTQLFDKNPGFTTEILKEVSQFLTAGRPIQSIVEHVERKADKLRINLQTCSEDEEIYFMVEKLLMKTHKHLMEEFVFECYDLLGYHKEFSDMAHYILDRNNENNQKLNNAHILKKLGLFYDRNGIKGTEYFYNSYILYIKKAELMLKYGRYEETLANYDEAKQCFIRFNTVLNSAQSQIEIARLNALLRIKGVLDQEFRYQNRLDSAFFTEEENVKDRNIIIEEAIRENLKIREQRLRKQESNRVQALKIIREQIVIGAQEKLSIVKQLKLLETSALIEKENGNLEICESKLKHGLAICENSAAFQSPSMCRLHKSDFYYQLGLFNLESLRANQGRKSSDLGKKLTGEIETNFKESLEIREREAIDNYDTAECLMGLGEMYYINTDYHESKKHYRRALIQMTNMKTELDPHLFVDPHYMQGSTCFYLLEFSEALNHYNEAIAILKKNRKDDSLLWTILGNKGLTLLELGEDHKGKEMLLDSLEFIKKERGEDHFDYVFLKWAYNDLLKKRKS